jgi:hypothetical protein
MASPLAEFTLARELLLISEKNPSTDIRKGVACLSGTAVKEGLTESLRMRQENSHFKLGRKHHVRTYDNAFYKPIFFPC